MRRFKKTEKIYIIASPAWSVRLEGMNNNVCVDSFFITKVSDPVRRILFVYPNNYCKPYPDSGAYLIEANDDSRRILELLGTSCEEAEKRVRTIPKRRFISFGLPIAPSKEEKMRVEAHYASELCSSVFNGDPRTKPLLESRKMYINYIIGEKLREGPSARIVKISSLDKGILEAVTDVINEIRRRHLYKT